MSTNGIENALKVGYKIQLQNRGAKSSGITFELKSVFDEMVQKGIVKDTGAKGLSKDEALNLYNVLNQMHIDTNRATNYTRMQVGQEFTYTAEEMKALAQAAGYEIVAQEPAAPAKPEAQTKPEAPVSPESETNSDPVIYDETNNATTNPTENQDNSSNISKPYEFNITRDSVDNKDKSSWEVRREQRREAREARREERREARELRQKIRDAESDFSTKGVTGKIVNGKYYLNGKEVTQDTYEVAKTRAASIELEKSKVEEAKASKEKTFNPNSELEGLTAKELSNELVQDSTGKWKTVKLNQYNNANGQLVAFERVSDRGNVKITYYVDEDLLFTKSTLSVDDYEQHIGDLPKESFVLNGMRYGFSGSYFSNNNVKIGSVDLFDSKGNLVARYENGEFVNSKGKKISEDKLMRIVERKSGLSIVENYEKSDVAE